MPNHFVNPPRAAVRGALAAALLLLCWSCTAPRTCAREDLRARMAAVDNIAIFPPLVTVYAEEVTFRFGLPVQDLVPLAARTADANAAVRDAFVAAGHEQRRRVVAFEPEEDVERNEAADAVDLFAAVDFSIQRHAYAESYEEFPEQRRQFDYSLGSLAACLDRQQAGAAWFVTGYILLPSSGAKLRDAVDVLTAIVAAAGRAPAMTTVLPKLELRAALVGRDGAVLFYSRIVEEDLAPAEDSQSPMTSVARRCVDLLLADLEKAAQ